MNVVCDMEMKTFLQIVFQDLGRNWGGGELQSLFYPKLKNVLNLFRTEGKNWRLNPRPNSG